MTLADEESQGGTEEHEPGHRQEEGTNERHGGNWGGAPDCLSFGRGEELPTEGPGRCFIPVPGHCRHPAGAGPARPHAHLLQQGESHPGRVLAVSNDHSCKAVVAHVDVAQIF